MCRTPSQLEGHPAQHLRSDHGDRQFPYTGRHLKGGLSEINPFWNDFSLASSNMAIGNSPTINSGLSMFIIELNDGFSGQPCLMIGG